VSCRKQELFYPSPVPVVTSLFLVNSVFLIFSVFVVVVLVVVVQYIVHDVSCVSGLSIVDFPFGFR
jgi:hypothetical protein